MQLGRLDSGATTVTIGQFNTWNFFDTKDDPHTADTVYSPEQYAVRLTKLSTLVADALHAPDVLALQEIENEGVLKDVLSAPALAKLGYKYVLGQADGRGIGNAIIYRTDRVQLASTSQPNPDSDLPPEDKGPNANKLFARGPLMATFSRLGGNDAESGAVFTVIANHFKSKLGGDFYEPRRQAQGAFVGGLVDAARAASPSVPVFVLGDLNATPADGAYAKLTKRADGTTRVVDTVDKLADADRYSYIYRGQKDLLDHMMVTPDMVDAVQAVKILHINSGTKTPQRFEPGTVNGTSDHDPILATIKLAS